MGLVHWWKYFAFWLRFWVILAQVCGAEIKQSGSGWWWWDRSSWTKYYIGYVWWGKFMSNVEAGDLSFIAPVDCTLCRKCNFRRTNAYQLSSSHLLDLGWTYRSSNHVLMQTGFCDVQGSIYQMMRHRCQTNLINLVVEQKRIRYCESWPDFSGCFCNRKLWGQSLQANFIHVELWNDCQNVFILTYNSRNSGC